MLKLRELKKIFFKKEIKPFTVACAGVIAGCIFGFLSVFLQNSFFADAFYFPTVLVMAVGIISLSQKNIIKGALNSLLFAALFEIASTLTRLTKYGFSTENLLYKVIVVIVLGVTGGVLWFSKKNTFVSKLIAAVYIVFLALFTGFAVFNDIASFPFHILSVILPLAAIFFYSLWLFEGKASAFFTALGCFIAVLSAVFLFTKAPFSNSIYLTKTEVPVSAVTIDDSSVADVNMTTDGIAVAPKKVGRATVTVKGTNGTQFKGEVKVSLSGIVSLELSKS